MNPPWLPVLVACCAVALVVATTPTAHCPSECSCHHERRWNPSRLIANCSSRSLTVLPQHFSHHIIALNASHNAFTELREDFFGGSKLKLTLVILSVNQISKIHPASFSALPDLWMLNLTSNKIETLHRDTFVYNVKLWYLILRDNKLKIPPQEPLLNATKLAKLDISSNHIRALDEQTFSQMSNLLYLRINDNELSTLKAGWFRYLPRLERLFLENNKLTRIDPDVFVANRALFELNLSGNRLHLPSSTPFLRLPNLEQLYLVGCDLGSIPDHMFELMPRVRSLWLGSNRLRSLDAGWLSYLQGLVYLNACGNQLVCDCRLHEVWQWCQYQELTADVNCATERSENGNATLAPAAPLLDSCVGGWDTLADLACNVSAAPTAHAAPLADGDTDLPGPSIAQLAGFAVLGTVILLALVAAAATYIYFQRTSTRPVSTSGGQPSAAGYTDMVPLNEDREECP